MNHRASLLRARQFAVCIAAIALIVACNAVLSNEEGTPRATSSDGGNSAEGGVACDTTAGSHKVCFGSCVSSQSIDTGCGVIGGKDDCLACNLENASARCVGGSGSFVCGRDQCATGFAHCPGEPKEGCATSLIDKNNCGGCGTECAPSRPACAFGNGKFECVATCPSSTTNCNGSCVDTNESIEHCGGCGKVCDASSGAATCSNGTCKVTCRSGTHLCEGVCRSDSNTKFCGSACTQCPMGAANQVASCDGKSCALACLAGFTDCDGNPNNGCETIGYVCGTTCVAVCSLNQQCCNGTCIANDVVCGMK